MHRSKLTLQHEAPSRASACPSHFLFLIMYTCLFYHQQYYSHRASLCPNVIMKDQQMCLREQKNNIQMAHTDGESILFPPSSHYRGWFEGSVNVSDTSLSGCIVTSDQTVHIQTLLILHPCGKTPDVSSAKINF